MSNKGTMSAAAIPASSRKIVQSLKEIVNCPEPEIYHMLKECNMDPNEAVNRLLSQDPFHEVKSKREKKKETKDGPEHRNRGAYNTSNRGSRSGADRYVGRSGSNQFGSNDSGALQNRPTYRKENGTHAYAGSSSASHGVAGNGINRRPSSYSESVATENKVPSVGTGDSALSFTQPVFQSAWSGAPGQVSMADIVKMGRPHNKAPGMPNQPQDKVPSQSRPASKPQEEWPPIEQPSHVNISSVLEMPVESGPNLDQKNHLPLEEDGPVETQHSNHAECVRHMQEDESKGASHFDNGISNQTEDGFISVAPNMQQLSLEEDDQGEQSEEDNPPVIIPNHLQVHAPECSQLSFGSFRCNASLSGSFASKPSEGNLDVTYSEQDVAAVTHPDSGNAEYYEDENLKAESTENVMHGSGPVAVHYDAPVSHYGDENLKAESTENLIHGTGPSAGHYDVAVSQPEVSQHHVPEPAGNQYAFSSSESGHGYVNHQHLDAAAYSQPLTSSQMQNLAPFSNVMQAYTGSAQNAQLPSSVQNAREPDMSYSPFSVNQSIPAKYHTGSSIGGQTISMSEALRAAGGGGISSPQPTQQILPSANVATGPAVPQQLLHPYSQPTLPLGPFANMISYPYLPQNYTYMPSTFQQAFANNNTYHQSLAAMLPQYKNSVSASNLPQSAAAASGYGFGNSTNIPGHNFPLNTPAAQGSTTLGFDEVLSSQYKDNSHIMSLQQQNDNSAMWLHGAGSRNMSGVPANTYYSFPGQSQQPPGFRQQPQQPPQDFGALGYPNYYQSGMPLEQPQNARDGSLGGSQGQQVKQTPQLWQNGY